MHQNVCEDESHTIVHFDYKSDKKWSKATLPNSFSLLSISISVSSPGCNSPHDDNDKMVFVVCLLSSFKFSSLYKAYGTEYWHSTGVGHNYGSTRKKCLPVCFKYSFFFMKTKIQTAIAKYYVHIFKIILSLFLKLSLSYYFYYFLNNITYEIKYYHFCDLV